MSNPCVPSSEPPFVLWRHWLSRAEADVVLAALESSRWESHRVRMFGREHPEPRQTILFGHPGTTYRYSGSTRNAVAWPPTLDRVRSRLRESGILVNAALANRYRDGADCVGWHSDNERDLHPDSEIATLVLGAARRVRFRPRRHDARSGTSTASVDEEVTPEHGDLYRMSVRSQRDWQHCVPRTRRRVGQRLALTFRAIVDPALRCRVQVE